MPSIIRRIYQIYGVSSRRLKEKKEYKDETVIRGETKEEQEVQEWYGEVVSAALDTIAEVTSTSLRVPEKVKEEKEEEEQNLAVENVELMYCIYQHECQGGVKVYPEEFKRNFMVSGLPRCLELSHEYYNNKKMIKLKNWRRFFAQAQALDTTHCINNKYHY